MMRRDGGRKEPLLPHSVTIPEEWHHCIVGVFQRYQFSGKRNEERRRRREGLGVVYVRAERGRDRCSGPEEASQTRDWWIAGPFTRTPH
ncbi:hypothetical protein EYF80_019187 [Liparis tanakae]|uniref:Uncharacterized protein n=1 Tax=Liparis tanakae TaxID=230148 RepID=A0A4Z2I044_9TELE|nr:hypothetical protein EYF80_019187 [Liparis tanakae]